MRRFVAAALIGAVPYVAFSQTFPSEATRAANAEARAALPTNDEDEELATHGLIATREDPLIRAADGRVVWRLPDPQTFAGPAPDSVNPSLWRHNRLLAQHGLFRVQERIYQVRGFDLSNMTIVVGDTGFIVLDPLTSAETARAALELARAHAGDADHGALAIAEAAWDDRLSDRIRARPRLPREAHQVNGTRGSRYRTSTSRVREESTCGSEHRQRRHCGQARPPRDPRQRSLRLRYEIAVEDPVYLTEPAALTQQWDHSPDLELSQQTEDCDDDVAARYRDHVPE